MVNPIPIICKDKIIGYSIKGDVYPINEITRCDTVVDRSIPRNSGRYQKPIHTGNHPWEGRKLTIKNVIFNDPATIVFWNDDTKTVVKAQSAEAFDPEKRSGYGYL